MAELKLGQIDQLVDQVQDHGAFEQDAGDSVDGGLSLVEGMWGGGGQSQWDLLLSWQHVRDAHSTLSWCKNRLDWFDFDLVV